MSPFGAPYAHSKASDFEREVGPWFGRLYENRSLKFGSKRTFQKFLTPTWAPLAPIFRVDMKVHEQGRRMSPFGAPYAHFKASDFGREVGARIVENEKFVAQAKRDQLPETIS